MMVKFVRNPTVNWSYLDSLETDRDSQYSKQMLKEMIERKRRNDFVRKREFDQLRKLRQREAQGGRRLDDALARASFFSTSMTSRSRRASILSMMAGTDASPACLAAASLRWPMTDFSHPSTAPSCAKTSAWTAPSHPHACMPP